MRWVIRHPRPSIGESASRKTAAADFSNLWRRKIHPHTNGRQATIVGQHDGEVGEKPASCDDHGDNHYSENLTFRMAKQWGQVNSGNRFFYKCEVILFQPALCFRIIFVASRVKY